VTVVPICVMLSKEQYLSRNPNFSVVSSKIEIIRSASIRDILVPSSGMTGQNFYFSSKDLENRKNQTWQAMLFHTRLAHDEVLRTVLVDL
jgi:hypothetical protein